MQVGTRTCFFLSFLALITCQGSREAVPAGSLLRSHDVVVFLGDSITEQGDLSGGFVDLVRKELNEKYEDFRVKVINAGKSGDKAEDMWVRLNKDVLALRPDWVVVSVGINDVWHRLDSPHHHTAYLPQFGQALREMVQTFQKRGIKVALYTTTVITEDKFAKSNQLLNAYNESIRTVAEDLRCLLIDVNDIFLKELQGTISDNLRLTRDGVHLNGVGNRLMASVVLGAFGFRDMPEP